MSKDALFMFGHVYFSFKRYGKREGGKKKKVERNDNNVFNDI
jgi:hypothetical protein